MASLPGVVAGAARCLFDSMTSGGRPRMDYDQFSRAWPVLAALTRTRVSPPELFQEASASLRGHLDKDQFCGCVAKIWLSASLTPDAAATRLRHRAWQAAAPRFHPIPADAEDCERLCEILDGELWLSSSRAAADAERILPLQISRVVSVGAEFEGEEPLSEHGVAYHHVALDGAAGESSRMKAAVGDIVELIEEAIGSNHQVLVHGAAGLSRSATVVLSFMMLKRGFSLYDAFERVLARRRVVWPHPGFMAFLIELDAELHGVEGSRARITIEDYEAWVAYADWTAQQAEDPVPRVDPEADAFNPGPSEIVRGLLFLGSGRDANDAAALDRLRVTLVINCADEVEVCEEARRRRRVWGMYMHDSALTDISALLREIARAVKAEQSKGGRVLVNCREGRSRSAALVMGYLVISERMDLATAVAHVRRCRPSALAGRPVEPNVGFMKQLRDLEFQVRRNRTPTYPMDPEDFETLCALELVTPEDRPFYCR